MKTIQNGQVFLGVTNAYEEVDIQMDQGIIVKIGKNLEPLGDVIDAKGCFVYPGFVEAHSHLGMHESSIQAEGNDTNEMIDPITPHVRGIDGCYPLDETIKESREAGVTTVATGPGSANVVGGTFLTFKTAGISIDEMLVKNPIGMKIAFGENPKRVYQGKSIQTRMGVAAKLRELLFESFEYKKRKDTQKDTPFNMKLEAMLPVVNHEIPLKAHVHRSDDILTAIRIAKEFGLDMTLDHCTDGIVVKDQIVKSGFPAIVGPSLGHKSKFELSSKSFETPKILQEAGVLVAITTDSPVIPECYLSLCAGLAHKAGMDAFEALKAITLNPAKILGIQNRVGSIEVGKDADIVISDGDILESLTNVMYTFINGEIVYQKS